MIRRLRAVITSETEPYRNLAVEESLLLSLEQGECILYLWQNRGTVVIGRNQNPWKECRAELLEAEGGFLVRRLSGGGAVFHDMGNLNFTFLARGEDYDVSRQIEVLLSALKKLGIDGEKTGRNDVAVAGRKVSGNAFFQTGDRRCHHGTILICTEGERMARYLTVSGEKLQSKGVSSVQSRVANLWDFCPEVTVEKTQSALCAAFEEIYQLPAAPIELCWETAETVCGCSREELIRRRGRFASWEWNYGKNLPFTWERSARFSWGGLTIRLQLEQGTVVRAAVESDAMDADWIASLPEGLIGCPFSMEALAAHITGGTQAAGELAEWLRRESLATPEGLP